MGRSKKSSDKNGKNQNEIKAQENAEIKEAAKEEAPVEETVAEEAVAEEAKEEVAAEEVQAEEAAKEAAAAEEAVSEEKAAEEVQAEEAPAEEVREETAEEEAVKEETSEEEKPKKQKGDFMSGFIRVAAIAFFFVALGLLFNIIYDYVSAKETDDHVKKMVDVNEPVKTVSERPDRVTPVYPGIMTPAITYPEVITLEKLQLLESLNPDFTLWFYIDGTDISYPVMYSGDNDMYLKRDFYKQSNISGSLFIDYRNTQIKGNTIIYGHNMKNGTMFGELRRYSDEVFFKQHTMIYTYSEDQIIAWKIFSAYPTNIFNNYIKTSFSSKDAYLKFLNKLQEDSLHQTDIVLTENDDILTLSTCRNGEGNNGRFVVHAVKIQTFPMPVSSGDTTVLSN